MFRSLFKTILRGPVDSTCYIGISHSHFFQINNVGTPLRSKLLFEIMPINFPNDFRVIVFHLVRYKYLIQECRSQWPRDLRRRSVAVYLLRLRVRIPPGAWIFVCCECRVSSGRGLYNELIIRPEESYRLWCVFVSDLETS
jgi:hypothetical protein